MDHLAGLTELWTSRWPQSPPAADQLREAIPDRWVRFHSLTGSKRYAENAEERAIVLFRHNSVLTELFSHLNDDVSPDQILVVTCAWGGPTDYGRESDLVAVDPDAELWRSDVWDQSDPEWHVWTHLWVSRRPWSPGALDPLLAIVADDQTAGVIVAPPSLDWLYHPYDGGGDVIAPNGSVRDELAAKYESWLSAHRLGL